MGAIEFHSEHRAFLLEPPGVEDQSPRAQAMCPLVDTASSMISPFRWMAFRNTLKVYVKPYITAFLKIKNIVALLYIYIFF